MKTENDAVGIAKTGHLTSHIYAWEW